MQLDYPDFDVIVSDNSTSDALRNQNLDAVRDYIGKPNFKVVRPPRVLSPPEHFEFALNFAKGDYVVYLTDKMVILPRALSDVDAVIRASEPDIVNWAAAPYYIDDLECPSGTGTLVEEVEFLRGQAQPYDPNTALRFKASCAVPRNRQSTKDYVAGKIVFGCYSRRLIDQIVSKSSTVFGGATHDYSAMIQALSLARSCVLLKTYALIFISLPPDKSLGSIITSSPQGALQYYRSFTDSDSILASLLVPGVYASEHNMVAHDYKKFLPIYGNGHLFNEANWLSAIYTDLTSSTKMWADAEERRVQIDLFKRYVGQVGLGPTLTRMRVEKRIAEVSESISNAILRQLYGRILKVDPRARAPISKVVAATSLNEAIGHIVAQRQEADVSVPACG
jgi:hypothetical protein